ncbi:uncharacterized protein CLUP02_17710 [Colletotrichum lupini]|uniref:Uncharacterized protein n=1 Tax=Colletotrichum lupini TaxID=145971 RepID=A0A9Q8SF35_9PEZI|nr:uncharacterized protein CLUP02_17710 [Colletotrichum lupini]UQC76197.1 hypothetical protein CLUP02_17710 [Colletotrichum lupini]
MQHYSATFPSSGSMSWMQSSHFSADLLVPSPHAISGASEGRVPVPRRGDQAYRLPRYRDGDINSISTHCSMAMTNVFST